MRHFHVRYNNGKIWTMISHLRSYCEIGNPGHELMNDKLIRGFCHDVEYTMIDFKKIGGQNNFK